MTSGVFWRTLPGSMAGQPAPPPAYGPRIAWRRWVAAALVLGAGAGVYAWRSRPAEVTVTPVVRGRAVEAVYATGTVEAERRVVVKAKVAGSVGRLDAREGQAVKEGDRLAWIDSPALAIELRRGKGDLGAARAQAGPSGPQVEALRAQERSLGAELGLAKKERDRLERLLASGGVAEAEVDRARARVEQVEGQIAANRAQQRALRIDLDAQARRRSAEVDALAARVEDAEVRAPLGGVVLARRVEPGEVVVVNQPLFVVGDVSSLVLEVAIDEADVARVSDGAQGTPASRAAVSLYAFPGRTFEAVVFEVLPDANRERKSFLAKLRFLSPPPALRSGMSAEVNVIVEEKAGALLAPSAALDGGFVWKLADGRVRRVPVQIGIRDLLRAEVLSGLEDGDRVVVESSGELTEGRRVRARERAADKGEAVPDTAHASRSGP